MREPGDLPEGETETGLMCLHQSIEGTGNCLNG